MDSAKDVLSNKGEKLHTEEMHIRRTKNKGFISKHDIRNDKGQKPSDGQKDSDEYSHANMQELLAHVQQTMGGAGGGAQQPGEEDDMQQPTQPGA